MSASVSVVVPVLDEGETLVEVLDRIDAVAAAAGGGWEVIVVDDGSAPSALAVHRRACHDAGATLVELDGNHGQAAALVTGLDLASGDVVATLDGDLQDPPEALPDLLEAIRGGAAFAKGLRRRRHAAWWRRAGSLVTSQLVRAAVPVDLPDYGGQLNAYRADAAREVVARWRPGASPVPIACCLGLPVASVAVDHEPRSAGRSRYRARPLVSMVAGLVVDHPVAPLVAPTALLAAGAALAAGRSVGSVRRGRRGAAVAWATGAALAAWLPTEVVVAARDRRGAVVVRSVHRPAASVDR